MAGQAAGAPGARLVITEGAIIGTTGSLAGAGLGLGAAAWFAGHLPARLLAIAAAPRCCWPTSPPATSTPATPPTSSTCSPGSAPNTT